jgi:hypothetical protein
VSYILVTALRINRDTVRYQIMSDKRVVLFLMGMLLVTLVATPTSELSNGLERDERLNVVTYQGASTHATVMVH